MNIPTTVNTYTDNEVEDFITKVDTDIIEKTTDLNADLIKIYVDRDSFTNSTTGTI